MSRANIHEINRNTGAHEIDSICTNMGFGKLQIPGEDIKPSTQIGGSKLLFRSYRLSVFD
ncbi:hypothetical protein N7481_010330 [Penicillium waksmanii]|uniref:uncharacterized protein n=1 Tax=Penicillium waksmanii TaxID=69791 RepID=UPI00254833D2|nr:uncharacterized protein N7481_010330 [Penicillium waksmanii]KAJ5976623.1 hypothetical protein N7481_010330 [Penicillium waksmanii]